MPIFESVDVDIGKILGIGKPSSLARVSTGRVRAENKRPTSRRILCYALRAQNSIRSLLETTPLSPLAPVTAMAVCPPAKSV